MGFRTLKMRGLSRGLLWSWAFTLFVGFVSFVSWVPLTFAVGGLAQYCADDSNKGAYLCTTAIKVCPYGESVGGKPVNSCADLPEFKEYTERYCAMFSSDCSKGWFGMGTPDIAVPPKTQREKLDSLFTNTAIFSPTDSHQREAALALLEEAVASSVDVNQLQGEQLRIYAAYTLLRDSARLYGDDLVFLEQPIQELGNSSHMDALTKILDTLKESTAVICEEDKQANEFRVSRTELGKRLSSDRKFKSAVAYFADLDSPVPAGVDVPALRTTLPHLLEVCLKEAGDRCDPLRERLTTWTKYLTTLEEAQKDWPQIQPLLETLSSKASDRNLDASFSGICEPFNPVLGVDDTANELGSQALDAADALTEAINSPLSRDPSLHGCWATDLLSPDDAQEHLDRLDQLEEQINALPTSIPTCDVAPTACSLVNLSYTLTFTIPDRSGGMGSFTLSQTGEDGKGVQASTSLASARDYLTTTVLPSFKGFLDTLREKVHRNTAGANATSSPPDIASSPERMQCATERLLNTWQGIPKDLSKGLPTDVTDFGVCENFAPRYGKEQLLGWMETINNRLVSLYAALTKPPADGGSDGGWIGTVKKQLTNLYEIVASWLNGEEGDAMPEIDAIQQEVQRFVQDARKVVRACGQAAAAPADCAQVTALQNAIDELPQQLEQLLSLRQKIRDELIRRGAIDRQMASRYVPSDLYCLGQRNETTRTPTSSPSGGGVATPTSSRPPSLKGLVQCLAGYDVCSYYRQYRDNPDAIVQCGMCELLQLAQRIINFVIYLAVLAAAIAFVYAGILYVVSPTNPGRIQEAHKIFWTVLWGLVITLAAWIIVNTVFVTLNGQSITEGTQVLCEKPKDVGKLLEACEEELGGLGDVVVRDGAGGGGGSSSAVPETEQEAYNQLKKLGVNLAVGIDECAKPRGQITMDYCIFSSKNKFGCDDKGCTKLAGLQPSTKALLAEVARGCRTDKGGPCGIIITGGTEGSDHNHGRYSHATGYKFDIDDKSANRFGAGLAVLKKEGLLVEEHNVLKTTKKFNDKYNKYNLGEKPFCLIARNEGDHIDYAFKPCE